MCFILIENPFVLLGHLCFPGSANHELSSNTEAELRKLSFSASLDNHSLHSKSTDEKLLVTSYNRLRKKFVG